MAFVTSCWKLPLCPIELLTKANGGSTSGITIQKGEKKPAQLLLKTGLCETTVKVSKEGEAPEQSRDPAACGEDHGETAVPLQPMESMGEQILPSAHGP